MNQLIKFVKNGAVNFMREEEGAQIIEYALIVAVVSLGLIVLMNTNLLGSSFTGWLTRVGDCLSGSGCS